MHRNRLVCRGHVNITRDRPLSTDRKKGEEHGGEEGTDGGGKKNGWIGGRGKARGEHEEARMWLAR
eukprot:9495954-Pyramimonas_sp.AAC.2